VVAEEYYTQGVIDFYPVLNKILANNPDIIDTEGQPGDQALMVKQLRELGYTGRIAESSYVPLGILIGTAGKDYCYDISTGLPDFECEYYSDEMRDLARRYMDEQAGPDETDMPDCVVHGYSQIMFLKKAFEQADSIDTDEVMKVFDDPDFRFERYYTPNAKLGGFETYGIRRQMPHFNPYCEIVLEDGEPKLVQMGGTVVEIP
jgi:branched-chain amino acid transport system substrate-binding protein